MAQSALQGSGLANDSADSGTESEEGELRAPNGRLAVLVENLWVGYVIDEAESGRGNSRTMVLFHVVFSGSTPVAQFIRECPGIWKKKISKEIFSARSIVSIDARLVGGTTCQLFTR